MSQRLSKKQRNRLRAEEENREVLQRLDQLLSWIEQTADLTIAGALPGSVSQVFGSSASVDGYLILKGTLPDAMSDSIMSDFCLSGEDGFGASSLFRSVCSERDGSGDGETVAIVSVAYLTPDALPADHCQYWPFSEEIRQRLAKFLLSDTSDEFRTLRNLVDGIEQRSRAALSEALSGMSIASLFSESSKKTRAKDSYH